MNETTVRPSIESEVESIGCNEVEPIRRILLRHPRDAFVNDAKLDAEWRTLNYSARPDFTRAIDEYEALISVLTDVGARIDYLPGDGGLTLDSLYVRDAAVVTPRGVVLCRMGKAARAREPVSVAAALAVWGVPVAGTIQAPGLLEGGDIVWLDGRTVAAGQGYRTNAEGIRQLQIILGGEVNVVPVPLPHWRGADDVFHLMSLISPIDENLALVYLPLLPVPFRQYLCARGMRLVEVPEHEFDTMGGNVLALAPRHCVMLAGNPLTAKRLEREGATVHVIAGQEISHKGSGGPTCLTRPLVRG